MINTFSIDWFKVINDLNNSNFDLELLGDLVGVHKQTVKNWKNGTEPRYRDGEKLIFLWVQATGKKRKQLPTISKRIYRC